MNGGDILDNISAGEEIGIYTSIFVNLQWYFQRISVFIVDSRQVY